MWSANDANIHAAVQLGEKEKKITRHAKQKSTRLHLTICGYFRSYALYLEGEDLKCTLSFHLHTPTTLVNASEEPNTTKYLILLKRHEKRSLRQFRWTFERKKKI